MNPRETTKTVPKQDVTSAAGSEAPAIPRDVLRDFLVRFSSYIKARKLYPPGHARPAKQLEIWLEGVEAILQHVGELGLFVTREFVAVCGERFEKNDRVVAELGPELIKRFIRFVAISRGVEARELEVLAEPLLVDPEVLKEAGGVQGYGHGLAQPHVLVIEFDYDMVNPLENEDDIHVIRRLARYAQVPSGERYVLNRMAELQIDDGERRWLKSLVFHPEIRKRIGSLGKLLRAPNENAEHKMHVSDLVLYLADQLAGVEEEAGSVKDATGVAVVAELLDRLRARVRDVARAPSREEGNTVFEELSRRMTATPESLIRSLNRRDEESIHTLTDEPAEVLKAIFKRASFEKHALDSADAKIEDADTPDDPGEDTPPPPPKEAIRAHGENTALAVALAELRRGLGRTRYTLQFKDVSLAHFDVLLELLGQETKPALRSTMLDELKGFLDRQLGKGMGHGKAILASRLTGETSPVIPGELEVLLGSPKIFDYVVAEFLRGEACWRAVLDREMRKNRKASAAAIGRIFLSMSTSFGTRELQEFFAPIQDELVRWLESRLSDPRKKPPIQRVVTLALACRTGRIVPLIHRLIGEVDPTDRRELMKAMVELDEARAVGALSLQLQRADNETRSAIIDMLERINHPLAEDALIEVAGQPDWHGERLHQRLAAITVLGRRGTEKSLEVLKRLSHDYFLLLTRGRRLVRAKAAEALAELEAHLWAKGG